MTLQTDERSKPVFLEHLRMTEEFLGLDGMWWERDRGEDQQYLDIASFEEKSSRYNAAMIKLLLHAGVDLDMIQPHVEREVSIGRDRRALFGLKIKVDKWNRAPSNAAVKKVRDFMIYKRDLAQNDFDGYAYDGQEMYGDAVNFVDYVLAVGLI